MSFLVIIICATLMVFSAYISLKIRDNVFPYYYTLITSFLQSFVWMFAVGFTKAPLVQISALIDVVYCSAFYIALYYFGEPIKPIQIVGLVLMLISIYFINK